MGSSLASFGKTITEVDQQLRSAIESHKDNLTSSIEDINQLVTHLEHTNSTNYKKLENRFGKHEEAFQHLDQNVQNQIKDVRENTGDLPTQMEEVLKGLGAISNQQTQLWEIGGVSKELQKEASELSNKMDSP